MPHTEKTCDPCGAKFTPGEYLSAEQADATKSCSHFCSSARIQGRPVDAPRAEGIGTLDASGRCVCSDCDRLRAEDRTAAVARYAAERGLCVATGPRRPKNASDLAKVAARRRKEMLETPEFSDDYYAATAGERGYFPW